MKRELKCSWAITAAAAVWCALPSVAGAEIVSTSQAIGEDAVDQDRTMVESFLDRKEAQDKLQAMGIDTQAAKDRVAGLTDREVHDLAQKLDTLPAGGNISNNNVIAILLVVLLVVLLI